MLTTYRKATKTLVFTRQNASKSMPTGSFLDIVVNPDNGVFEALWIQSLEGIKCLLPRDILLWNEKEIQIQDNSELNDPEDLPRLTKVLEKEVPILKASVWVENQTKSLGQVYDFAFDTISPRILSLHVATSWMGRLGPMIKIPAQRIVKIDTHGITITNNALKLSKKEKPLTETIKELDKKLPEMDSRGK